QAKELQAEADKVDGRNDTEQMLLQNRSREMLAEANDISENWGAGGTYRQITTALIGAAGGNISAGNAAFVQGLVVNYVQQRGAGYIGDLVAKGELTEGSPLHAALHGIVACAGAAASSQSCGSGAAGAAASSLLTGLFSQSSPDESEEQREAKRNLIVSLVTGLAATSTSIDPTAANTAAGAAVDNNWLATQQIVQYKKEYAEAKGTEVFAVFAKWAFISSKQDVLTQFGIGKGLAQSGWSDVTGMAEFIAHPIDGLNGLKALVNDPAARSQFGEALVTKLNAQIDQMKTALEQGGDQNAVLLGESIGEIAWQVGSIATGVGGAASGGVALAKAGIKVGTQQLEKMAEIAKIEKLAPKNAKNPNPMSPMTDSETTILVDRNVLEAGAQGTGKALEQDAKSYFGQQRKYWTQEPIQFNGNKVYQRNDLIDPGRVDSQTGLTNMELMKNGLAPYGPDGKKINLHHILQTQDGPIAEVTQNFHQLTVAPSISTRDQIFHPE
ncbi:hypothetical protein L4G47_26840, partial [Pseudomonas sp. P2647]